MTVSLRSNQALQASTLVGRAVFVPSNDVAFDSDETIKVALFVTEETSNVIIYLENESGEVVLCKEVGDLPEGDLHIDFDTLDGGEVNLGGGKYFLRAEGEIKNQRKLIPTYTKAIVESVKLSTENHEPMLNLKSNQSVALSKVRIIL